MLSCQDQDKMPTPRFLKEKAHGFVWIKPGNTTADKIASFTWLWICPFHLLYDSFVLTFGKAIPCCQRGIKVKAESHESST